jgi:hypothetical protein
MYIGLGVLRKLRLQAVGDEWDLKVLIGGIEERGAIQSAASTWLRKIRNEKSFTGTW